MLYLDEGRKRGLSQAMNGIAKLLYINAKRDIERCPKVKYFSGLIQMSAIVAIFEAVDPIRMELGDTFTYDDIITILNDTPAGQLLQRHYGFRFATGRRRHIYDEDERPSLLIIRY